MPRKSSVNLSDVLEMFNNGTNLSSIEVVYGIQRCHAIQNVLLGEGQMFAIMRKQISQTLISLQDVAIARGINHNPDLPTCPHCLKELVLPDCVIGNVTRYDSKSYVSTPCCGKPVMVYKNESIRTRPTETAKECDDWGTPYKK